ncbi:sugar-binding domain protein [Winkia neuii]|uniref:LacI family DNA-binding transcriptional regulator n=1 Tax=Winkia neuii TaxID=33007 RepID=UPI000763BCAD|nr:LacI family DNA-binding transcriptional regulator [Winkia neuii]KWZ74965.1 sugar-binding domain protein [Winkia neuii]
MTPKLTRQSRVSDIAKALGVSPTAVSFALNGKPGISKETRERILTAIEEINWSPHYAARALSDGRTSTIGLVIARDPKAVGSEAFFMQLMTGMQATLSKRGYGLLFQVAPSIDQECTIYQQWADQKRVDAVAVVDLRKDDPRPKLLSSLGMRAVIAGDTSPLFPSVDIDDSAAMTAVGKHLCEHGHERVAYIAGSPQLHHVRERARAFSCLPPLQVEVEYTDFSGPAAAAAVRRQLEGADPSAYVFENEALTIAGVQALRHAKARIGIDVAVVSLEDSLVCEAMSPTITALHRDTYEFGKAVAGALLEQSTGTTKELSPQLIERESTSTSF